MSAEPEYTVKVERQTGPLVLFGTRYCVEIYRDGRYVSLDFASRLKYVRGVARRLVWEDMIDRSIASYETAFDFAVKR